MLRKAGLTTALLLALPAFANAWTVTAKVGSGLGTITSDRAAGTVDKSGSAPVIGYFKTATNAGADLTQVLTFGAPAGYKLSSVLLDGVAQPAAVAAGSLSVAMGPQVKNHTVVAYYAATTYALTVQQPAAGGSVAIQRLDAAGTKRLGTISRTTIANLKDGDKVLVIALPNSDNKVVSVAGDVAATGLAGEVVTKVLTFNHNSASVTASFGVVPSVTANLIALDSTNRINTVFAAGSTINLAASTVANTAVNYTWSGCGVTDANSKTNTVAPASDCTVTVQVTSAADATVFKTASLNLTIKNDRQTSIGTCTACHSSRNAALSANFLAGKHATTTYDEITCATCHVPVTGAHATVPVYTAYSAGVLKADVGCQSCHTPGASYAIYSSNLVGKAPHFGGPDNQFGATSSYITTGGATCVDCHGHNNSINRGWAEGGHGDVTAVPWKSDSGHTWNAQGPAANGVNFKNSPQQTNCIRCHTAAGFAKFVDSGFTNIDQIKLADGTVSKASAPLTCNGCHTSAEGGLRLAGFNNAGYKAYWGYSTVTYAKKKIVTSIQLGDNKNSNICTPCHAQRASGQEIKDLFAAPAFKQYSVGSNIYPHAAQPAAIFWGKGGYEFASAETYVDRARHQRIGNYGTGTGYNNTGVTQGSCVACHMSSDATHSLEITAASFTNTCYKCHPSSFNQAEVDGHKAEFDAAVAALGKLLVQKGITLDGVNPLPERKAFDMSKGTKDNAIAEKNIGAWFNWYLFSTSDKGAYAHNPSYARRLIVDSIDWLDDNKMNASYSTTISGLTAALPAGDAVKAAAFTNDPGCLGCHFSGTDNVLANGEVIPAIEKAPHYNTTGALVPGQTFTQAQFVVSGAQCNNCHGIGHGTDSPNYSASKAAYPNLSSVQGKGILANYAESAHGDINGLAWTDYNFLNLSSRSMCTPCHTTQGFIAAVNNANANAGKFTTPAFIGNAADTTKQVLGCNTCHSSTTWKSSVRTINGGYVAGMGGFGLAQPAYITYPDAGESNVCIPCHASRENGASINAATADFSNTGFKNPHYLAASAVFYGKGGFQFYTSGVRYNTYGAAGKVGRTANWSHGKLGMDNYTTAAASTANAGKIRGSGNKGQCVACHLGPTNTHTFGAFETAKATWGTNSTGAKGCFGCHNGEDMEEVAVGEKANVDRALDLVAYELEQYGLFFNNDKNPYFFTDATSATSATNWTANPYTVTVTGKQTMGAAMNLKLLKAEKGSHVHNRSFMRALITDSLVYLQKGQAGIDADRTALQADVNSVISFTAYSTAVSAPNTDRLAAKSGSSVSISALKSYLTRTSGGKFYRR